jgi:type IV fimbrial biogenesis protein FimT
MSGFQSIKNGILGKKVSSNKNRNGFTIIELMITVAIVAVFVAVGIPGFSGLIRDNRLVTDINSLVASLQLARSEAIRRSVQVSIRRTSATGNEWGKGWEVFTDVNGNGARDDDGDTTYCEPADTDCLLQVHSALSGGNTLTTSTEYDQYLTYQPTGLVIGTGGNAGDFTLCKQESGEANFRQVTISATGRPSTSRGTVTTCP